MPVSLKLGLLWLIASGSL